ncbi:MAG TPA: hypothetical protein VG322_00635 [Candidatus Acidoferrales bacterium]|jgi:hypothetical protein|nr:hypothetical protein [Candidatus Acidoferrales bacterium]
MQNRYVGDIGDYVKLAILRALAAGRNLGVVWWMFPDQKHNKDGSFRKYLERPQDWRKYDADLFDALKKIVVAEDFNVHAIETSGVLPKTVFIRDPVPCECRPFRLRPGEREVDRFR